jgi:hypothetical protein
MPAPDSNSSPRELQIAILGLGPMARRHAAAIPRVGVSATVVTFADPEERAREFS